MLLYEIFYDVRIAIPDVHQENSLAPIASVKLDRPIKTIERQIKELREKFLIERQESKKTGGMWQFSHKEMSGKKNSNQCNP